MSWNIVQDAIDAIQNWFKGVLADGIVGSLRNACDTLNNTFNTSNQGLMTSLLSDTPDKFTGSTSGSATPVWNSIEVITNHAIVPIAIFVLVIIIMYDLFQMVLANNNFRDFDTSIFIRWLLKAVCGIMLVSNVFYIATGIFSFGSMAVTEGLNQLFPGSGSYLGNAVITGRLRDNLVDNCDIGELLVLLILAFLVSIVTFLVLGAIIIVLATRMIEIFMYLSISPIPMATMMNNDWGQIGKNWLRNMLALAFQGFFIVVALTIFKVLLTNVITQMANPGSDSAAITGSMAIMLGYIIALIFTIFRSSSISKSAFAAQ